MAIQKNTAFSTFPILLIISRMMRMLTLPPEGLRGYGDLIHFYRLAGMGVPFFNYRIEFPPSSIKTFVWRLRHVRKAFMMTIISLSIVLCVYGLLLYISAPEMGRASLIAQASNDPTPDLFARFDDNNMDWYGSPENCFESWSFINV